MDQSEIRKSVSQYVSGLRSQLDGKRFLGQLNFDSQDTTEGELGRLIYPLQLHEDVQAFFKGLSEVDTTYYPAHGVYERSVVLSWRGSSKQ